MAFYVFINKPPVTSNVAELLPQVLFATQVYSPKCLREGWMMLWTTTLSTEPWRLLFIGIINSKYINDKVVKTEYNKFGQNIRTMIG